MSRIVLAVSLALGALLLVLPATTGGVAQARAARSVPDLNQRGFDELNRCLSTHRRVDALYVMDVSGSLRANDPDGRRFDALEASVAQLGVLASAGRGAIDVYASVSTFGDSFTPPKSVQDWTHISGEAARGTATTFRRSAVRAWQRAGTAQGTNYQAAMSGARSVMQARGSSADACQVVFWFTDGLFALGDPYDASATDDASAQMCATGGLLDQMRQDQISVVALALTGPDVDAQLATAEYAHRRRELEAMALGTAGSKSCGTAPIPIPWRSGIYLSADDPAALGALFSGVAAQAAGCVPQALKTSLPAEIPVDSGVRKFQVDVSSEGGSSTATVIPPGGRPITAHLGITTYDGGRVRMTQAGSLTTLTVAMNGPGQLGTWSIAVGSARLASAVTLYRCSDLHIDIAAPSSPVQGGELTTLDAVIRDSSGAPANMTAFRGDTPDSLPRLAATSDPASDISAEFTDASTGKLRVTLTPPRDKLSIEIAIGLTPRLRDPAGTELSQVTGSRPIPVAPPASFPTITPAGSIDLGSAHGLEPARATLVVRGSAEGKSQVCFARATNVDAPKSAGVVRVTTSLECRTLAKNQQLDVTVAARPSASSDGFGRASLPITLTNAHGEKIQQDAVVRWKLERPVDQGRRLWLLLVALVIALVLPLVGLAIVNWLLARFGKGDVRHATYDVHVTEGGDINPTRPISTGDLVSTYVQGADRRRISNLGDSAIDLRAKAPLNPLGSPVFTANASPGSRLISDGDLRSRAKSVEVTGGLGAVWLLSIHDSDLLGEASAEGTPGRLTLITRGEGQGHLDQLFTRAVTALAEGRWSRMRIELERFVREDVPERGARTVDESHAETSAGTYDDDDPFGSSDGRTTAGTDVPSHGVKRRARARRSFADARRPKTDEVEPTPTRTGKDDYEDPFA